MATFEMTNQATFVGIISEACVQLSLPVPADPAGSQDPNIALLRSAVNLAALELMTAYEWQELTRMGEIMVYTDEAPNPSNAIEKAYPLPEDFYRFVDQTQWNGAMRFPAVGPVSPQGWMTYMVFPISANFTLTWQIREGQIWFLNPPAAPGQAFKFMYMSRAIWQDGSNPDIYRNLAKTNSDKSQLDGLLLTLLTVVKWLEKKGFDSQAAVRDFMVAFDSRCGSNKGANILNMAGGRIGYPYIGIGNLPDASLYGMRQN